MFVVGKPQADGGWVNECFLQSGVSYWTTGRAGPHLATKR